MSLLSLLRNVQKESGVTHHPLPSSREQEKLCILVCSPTPKFNKEAAFYLPIVRVASTPFYKTLQPYSLSIVHLIS